VKVAIFLGSAINPTIGGNFSYHEKMIRSIDEHNFSDKLEICFVGRMSPDKVGVKKEYFKIAPRFLYKSFRVLEELGIIRFCAKFFFINCNINNRLDVSLLRKKKVDIVVFPKQFLREVENFPYITMNWDAGHKTTFAFPELLANYEAREQWHRLDMQKALAIFVESQSSKEEFAHYFSIPENKIEIVPLFAGGVVDLKVDEIEQEKLLHLLTLKRLTYYYYPAQFWAHKNHYNLILAFKQLILRNEIRQPKLVLSGSDKGNKEYILKLIDEMGLQQHVLVLGFISNEEVYTLYKNAIALVMPTFLGPTNMPLLEAQALQTAIICSDLKGHRETCADGAIYVDPTDVEKWCRAMESLLNDDNRRELVNKGEEIRIRSKFNIAGAIEKFEEALIKFIAIRKTFS
jgi:glycosyltransferase involved in cell wall biosynthesis